MSDSPHDQPPSGNSKPTYEKNKFDDSDLQSIHAQLMREKEEPSENFAPMPLFFVALFMVLAFWAGIYIVHYSGDFGQFHYDETRRASGAPDTGPREVDMLALGKRVYSQNCVACHQASGLGLPGVYPTLVASDWVMDNPERLVKVMLAGLAGPVVVNGRTYNNAMTAFGRLKDRDVAAVLTYLRTDPAFNNNSVPVAPELVASVRAAYGARTDPWSQAELEAIHGPVTGRWSPPAAAVEAAPEAAPADAETAAGAEDAGTI